MLSYSAQGGTGKALGIRRTHDSALKGAVHLQGMNHAAIVGEGLPPCHFLDLEPRTRVGRRMADLFRGILPYLELILWVTSRIIRLALAARTDRKSTRGDNSMHLRARREF